MGEKLYCVSLVDAARTVAHCSHYKMLRKMADQRACQGVTVAELWKKHSICLDLTQKILNRSLSNCLAKKDKNSNVFVPYHGRLVF